MAYQVLARKWRPATLQDMVGQSHACDTLTQALESERLHHAYLFTGTRGVGKTSIARIFAKCLNCEQGITAKPCGQCASCQAIEKGNFVDLIEVDAASRTRVEETRDLLDNVPYAPAEGRFKIYLIDEVHMLSTHSFNALLKTLEEPPEHVKFMLATTDPEKLPVTILSRCLQFHLRAVPLAQLSGHLQNILESESIPFEPEALRAIGRAASGSVRDALSLLEQAIAYGHQQVTLNAVQAMLGTTGQGPVLALLDAVLDKQAPAVIEQVAQMASQGVVFDTVLEHLLHLLHGICLGQMVPGSLEERYEDSQAVLALSKRLSPEMAQLYYQMILLGRRDFHLALDPVSGFEMLLLRLMAFDCLPKVPEGMHTPVASAAAPPSRAPAPSKVVPAAPKASVAPQEKPQQAPLEADPLGIPWDQVVMRLGLTGLNRVLVSHCSVRSWAKGTLELVLDAAQSACLNETREKDIQEALQAYAQQPVSLVIDVAKESGAVSSPAAQAQAAKASRETQASEAATEDEKLKALVDAFDATIEKVSAVDPE